MKIFMISLALLAGLSLASAFTPEQNTTLEGMGMTFQLGMAYQQAKEGQNVTGFNALVDRYNAWMVEHFGNETNLLMQKMNNTSASLQNPYAIGTEVAFENIIPDDGTVYAGASNEHGPSNITNDSSILADSVIANYDEQDQAPNVLTQAQTI